MNFKHYMTSHYAGCRLVARGFDPHRERDVRMYQIPGTMEVLGVDDGTDRWIAPLTSPFLAVVLKALRDEASGEPQTWPIVLGQRPGAVGRRKLLDEAPATPAPPRARKQLVDEPAVLQAPVRRRALLEE